jgi:excisionase family DNA binding protein
VNLKSAARRLGVHYQTAYRWVRSGQLVAVKIGSGYEISEAALTRFQAQREAVERVPDFERSDNGHVAAPTLTRDGAIAMLDDMLAAVTIDARPVAERGARVVADLLGDVAVVYGLLPDGGSAALYVSHRDPVAEVSAATVARHGDPGDWFAHLAMRDGDPLFVPQVPQRDLRRRIRPEIHHNLAVSGCYSAMSVPLIADGVPVAALVTSRDTPTQPFTREDLDFVRDVAARVQSAYVIARRGADAWELRQRVVDAVRAAPDGTCGAAMFETVSRDDAVALVDLQLRHLAATDEYHRLLGREQSELVPAALAPMARDAQTLRDALSRVLFGELDYCQVPIVPVSERGRPTMLHAAMVRADDATPCCLVVVAHALPDGSEPSGD